MTPGEFIELLVERNIQGNVVNVINIAKELNISIYQSNLGSITELATLKRNDDGKIQIVLNKINDNRHNYTLVALLIAELLLNPEKADKGGYSYDVFKLRDVRANRYSQTMMLATRLAVPEEIIAKMDEFNFNMDEYTKNSKFLPEFIKCAVKAKNLSFLVNNDMTGVLNLSR